MSCTAQGFAEMLATQVGLGSTVDSSIPAHHIPARDDRRTCRRDHGNAACEPDQPGYRGSSEVNSTTLATVTIPGGPNVFAHCWAQAGQAFIVHQEGLKGAALRAEMTPEAVEATILLLIVSVAPYSMAAAKMVSSIIPALERLVLALFAGRRIVKTLPTRGGRVALASLVSGTDTQVPTEMRSDGKTCPCMQDGRVAITHRHRFAHCCWMPYMLFACRRCGLC